MRRNAYRSQDLVHYGDSINVTTAITTYYCCYSTWWILFLIQKPFHVYPLLSNATALCIQSDLHLFPPGLLYSPPNWSPLLPSLPGHPSSCQHRITLKTQVWPHISPTYCPHQLPATGSSKSKLCSMIYKTNSCLVHASGFCFISYYILPCTWLSSNTFSSLLKHTTPLQKLSFCLCCWSLLSTPWVHS